MTLLYDVVTVNAGHSPKAIGASGNGYQEHAVARQMKDKLISSLRSVGQTTYDTTSEADTPNKVLQEQVKKCDSYNQKGKKQLDVSIHLNAGGGTGTEVLYYDQQGLASYVSKEISNVTGWRNRGGKERKDLYFLKNTHSPAILIEVCFIDSKSDMKLLYEHMNAIVNNIVKCLTGQVVQPPKEPVKQEGLLYRVVTGSFADQENAKQVVNNLKEKGFDSFIDVIQK